MVENADRSPESPIEQVERWINRFLAMPNDNLGRLGAVCPFVKPSMEQGMMKIKQVDIQPDADILSRMLRKEKESFAEDQSMKDGSNLIYASKIIVLPQYSTEADACIADEVQSSLKVDFMNDGLMIGQFHPFRKTPGLHNQNLMPHACPAFCFAIRHMIQSDHMFVRQSLPKEQIGLATAAFLKRFSSTLPPEVINNLMH